MKKVALVICSLVVVAAAAALIFRSLSPSGVEGDDDFGGDGESDEQDQVEGQLSFGFTENPKK